MRVLTTAINDGERKVPEGHKVTHYRLAPGRACKLADQPGSNEVVEVGPADCKRSEYTFCLRWLDGRTVAEFTIGKDLYVQPVKDDPKPKRKRGEDTDDEGQPVQAPAPEPGRARRPLPAPEEATPEPSGGRTLVKGAGSRRRALPAFVPLRK